MILCNVEREVSDKQNQVEIVSLWGIILTIRANMKATSDEMYVGKVSGKIGSKNCQCGSDIENGENEGLWAIYMLPRPWGDKEQK